MTTASAKLRLAQRPGALRLRSSNVGRCLPSGSSSNSRAVSRRHACKVNAKQTHQSAKTNDLESALSLENFLLTTSFLALADPAFAEEEAQVATEAVSETAAAQVADTATQVAETVAPVSPAIPTEASSAVSDTVNQVAESIPDEAVNPLVKYAVYSVPTILYLLWTVFRSVNRKAKFLDFVNLIVGIVVIGNIVSIVFFKVRWF